MNNFIRNEMWYMVPKIFSLWINCMPQKYALICCHYLSNITVGSSILGERTCMWFRGHLELGCIYAYTCRYIASRESSSHHIHLYLSCANYQTILCPLSLSLSHTHTHIRAWKWTCMYTLINTHTVIPIQALLVVFLIIRYCASDFSRVALATSHQ